MLGGITGDCQTVNSHNIGTRLEPHLHCGNSRLVQDRRLAPNFERLQRAVWCAVCVLSPVPPRPNPALWCDWYDSNAIYLENCNSLNCEEYRFPFFFRPVDRY